MAAIKRSKTDDEAQYDEDKQKRTEMPPPATVAVQVPTTPAPAPPSSSSSAPAAPAPPVPQEVITSPHVIYAKDYDQFDPKKIAFAPTAQPSREGGGQILFISYVYPDGQTRPLLLNTPRGLHCPMGVKIWKDGKASVLLSLGRDYATDEKLLKFKQICDAIEQRCAEVSVEKSWMGATDLENTKKQFSNLMFVGTDAETGLPYPPCMKAVVTVSGKDQSEFFKHKESPPFPSILPGELTGSCSMTAVLHIAWIYTKKTKKGIERSIRASLFQGIVENIGGISLPRTGACNVLI